MRGMPGSGAKHLPAGYAVSDAEHMVSDRQETEQSATGAFSFLRAQGKARKA